MEAVKPKVSYYHYSNPRSQGALICKTKDYPEDAKDVFQKFHHNSGYVDRIQQWDAGNHQKMCDMVNDVKGHGDANFPYALPKLSDDELKEVAKVALKLDSLPDHTRWVFYYNVSSGYGCPVVETLTKK